MTRSRIRRARKLVGDEFLIIHKDCWQDTLDAMARYGYEQGKAAVTWPRRWRGVPVLSPRVSRSDTRH